jgi:DNA-binding CsgD family transcriptional regulator
VSAASDAGSFVESAKRASHMGELTGLLSEATRELGFDCVTLIHHIRPGLSKRPAVAYSDYPMDFLATALARRYITDDPVLVACERRAAPFAWSDLPKLVTLEGRRREILEAAAASGLREGFTVPINVPGETPASCSFGMMRDRPLPEEGSQAAMWVGVFAFEQARRILGLSRALEERPRLSPRQLECVVWAGRGKSDSVIAEILGLSTETVREYVAGARRRYDVATRQQLLSSCLQDGQVTFADLLS